MTDNIELKISHKQSEVQLASIAVVGVAVYLLMFFFVNSLGSLIGQNLDWMRRFGGLIIMGFVAMGMIGTWRRGRRFVYTLTPDSLVVVQTTNMFGGKRSKIYPYKHITSLEMHQSMMGKRSNYGSITVNMERLEDPDPLVLYHLADPKTAFTQIQQYMKTST